MCPAATSWEGAKFSGAGARHRDSTMTDSEKKVLSPLSHPSYESRYALGGSFS